jgi:hypothetical protein
MPSEKKQKPEVEVQLVVALRELYCNLLERQHDLDPESREILYKNLWDLYE